MTRPKDELAWEEFLNPDLLRSHLVNASLYITAYELLEDAIVDRIKAFYMVGPEYKGIFPNHQAHQNKYQSEVLSKNSRPVHASLEWLKESEAISDEDIAALERAKTLRNKIVHELAGVLFKGLPSDLSERFNEMVSLLDKIERWWIVNVDMATDPQFHAEEIDEKKIVPGRILSLRLMIDIALGPPEVSEKYLEEFIKQTKCGRPQ